MQRDLWIGQKHAIPGHDNRGYCAAAGADPVAVLDQGPAERHEAEPSSPKPSELDFAGDLHLLGQQAEHAAIFGGYRLRHLAFLGEPRMGFEVRASPCTGMAICGRTN